MRRFRAALTGACTTLANTHSWHPTLYRTPASPYLHFSYTIHTVSIECMNGCLSLAVAIWARGWICAGMLVDRSFCLDVCCLTSCRRKERQTDLLKHIVLTNVFTSVRVYTRVRRLRRLRRCLRLPRSRLSIALSMCVYVRVCINAAADFAQDLYSLYRHEPLRSIRCKNC